MQIFLTFDVGTTAMKCCAFDRSFRLLRSETTEYALSTPDRHRVEVDPAIYWNGLCASARKLFADGALRPEDVAAVGLTTQGETLIVLDGDDEPILPAIVWIDDRAEAEAEALARAFPIDRFYRTTGLSEFNGALPAAKLRWLMNDADIRRRARRICLLEDYLIYKLTGAFVTEHSLVCSTGYYDIVRRRCDPALLEWTGVSPDMLPEVLPCGSVAGRIGAEAARACGLTEGTPVACTAMDQTASAVGAGNVLPGMVTETTGTCLTVAATAAAPDFNGSVKLQYYTHYDGGFLALAYDPTAAVLMKWFREQFLTDEEIRRAGGENPYQYMSRLAADVPAGCGGLLLLPHFSGKASCPGVRGCLMGLGLDTTRAHVIRAVMEGVAFLLRQDLERLEAAGIPTATVRSLGGGSRDLVWNAIKASVTGRELVTVEVEESTSLGAAILAAHAVGAGAVPELCRAAVRTKKTYSPKPEERGLYDRIYRDWLRLDAMAEAFAAGTR